MGVLGLTEILFLIGLLRALIAKTCVTSDVMFSQPCSGIVIGLVQAFVGSERVVTARVFVGHESAMSALGTGLVGFVKTTVVNEFPAAEHHVTSQDGSNV